MFAIAGSNKIADCRARDTAHAFAVTGNKCVGRGVTIHDDDLPLSIVLLAAGIEKDRRQSQVIGCSWLHLLGALRHVT